MARYEIRIAFEDPADAKVQHQRWSIACDAGRSPIEGADRPRLVRLRDRTGPSAPTVPLSLLLDMGQTHYRLAAEERSKLTDALEKRLATAEERSSEHHDRLVELESALGEPACIGCGKSPADHHEPGPNCGAGVFPIVMDRLAHLETEHAALVVRVGELEMLPEPIPGMSDRAERDRLFALRDRAACGCLFADCTKHGAFGYITEEERLEAQEIAADFARDPAPVRPEPGSVAEDPDRLAKVAHVASLRAQGMTETLPWSPAERAVCCAIAAAVAEANGLENDVLAKGLDDITAERDTLQAELATLRANRLAKVAEPTAEELDRRFGVAYVNACEAGRHATAHFEGRRAIYNLGREHGNRERDVLLARAEALKGQRAEDMRRGFAIAVEHVRDGELYHSDAATALRDAISELPKAGTRPEEPTAPDATRPAATPSEAEMAAELRREGWTRNGEGWIAPTDRVATICYTENAHAAMRAAKGAK